MVDRPGRRRWIGLAVCVLVLAGAAACTSNSPGTGDGSVASITDGSVDGATTTATPAPAPATEAAQPSGGGGGAVDTSLLSDAGVVIGADEAAVLGADGAFRMLDVQARRLVADLVPADGVPGSELDEVVTMPAGAPPISFVLASWISSGATPTAVAAQTIMGEQDWQQAPTVTYPMAVVTMFVADVAAQFAGGTSGDQPSRSTDATTQPPTTASGSTASTQAAGNGHATTIPTSVQGFRSPAAASGPCTAVTGFLTSVIGGLFDALRVTPPASGSNLLVSIVNGAISLAQAAVQGLVDLALEPALAAIRLGVGALGVVSTIISLFTNESLTVTVEPAAGYQFEIDGTPPPSGEFIARARELTSDWPAIVVDCAKAAGATLPELLPAGAPAHWTVDNAFGVIQPGDLDTTVQQDKTARLKFVTGNESKEQFEKGRELNERANVEVRVPRPEIDAFLQLAKSQVAAAEQALLSKVPAGAGREAAQAAVKAAIDPTVNALSDQVNSQLGGVFTLKGRSGVFVKHHAPPETTTTVPQGFEVTYDRPAIFPLEAGQIIDFVSCTGVFGTWTGVIRNGGLNGGGVVIPFQDIPISFTFDGPDQHVATTHSESDLVTPLKVVHVVLDVVITINDDLLNEGTMTVSGTGAASDDEIGISGLVGTIASDLPIERAPAGTC